MDELLERGQIAPAERAARPCIRDFIVALPPMRNSNPDPRHPEALSRLSRGIQRGAGEALSSRRGSSAPSRLTSRRLHGLGFALLVASLATGYRLRTTCG
jgi:hypothetical protein